MEISRGLWAFALRLVDIRQILCHVLERHKLAQVAFAVAIGAAIIVGQANSISRCGWRTCGLRRRQQLLEFA